MNDTFVEINTDQMQPPKVGVDLFTNRASVAEMQIGEVPEVTILVLAYNRVEKTRRCVESILKYTTGIDYELILIDNGSTDGTLEYFQSVQYENKRIIHVTKNIGAGYPYNSISIDSLGRYICPLSNDLIVTEHWMHNLLTCIKSDARIGMVNPVSNNTSNLQCVEFAYRSYEEMQKKAADFNVSDPRKWEERLRLITLGTLWRKEVLLAMGWPLGDLGFFHDFSDDDATFAVRRSGYRTVLAGDTWICHDHNLSAGEGKNPVEHQQSLLVGRENFQIKYFGVDAWDDVNNYLLPYMGMLSVPVVKSNNVQILGVDVRCGTPILDIKNWLRKRGAFDATLSAFIQDPKYWVDLKTICDGPVICDREEFLMDSFPREYFDYVVVDRPINRYHEPQKIINDLFAVCKKGGVVICRLKNTTSYQEYINMLGQYQVYDREVSYHITLEAAVSAFEQISKVQAIVSIPFGLGEDDKTALMELLSSECEGAVRNQIVDRLSTKEYLIALRKI